MKTKTKIKFKINQFEDLKMKNHTSSNFQISKLSNWLITAILIFNFSALQTFNCSAQSADDLYIKAKVQIEYKQYQNAIDIFASALSIKQGNRELYMERGQCFYQLKKYTEALTDFMKADSMENNFASFQIAKCQTMLGNNDDALLKIKNNLQSKYKLPLRIFKLEKAFEPLQKSKEWRDLWKEEWYSSLENSISEITYFYENNKNDKALELAETMLLKHKNNLNLLHIRGKILFALNDFESAENDFNELIRLKPYETVAYAERAEVYQKLSKFSKAAEDFQKAIELDHFNIVLFKKKAEAEWKIKQYDKALEDLNKYLSYYSNDQEAIYSCGLIYYDKQDYFSALSYFNNLLKKNKKEIRYYVARGNTFLMCKSYKFAEQDFTQALDLKPNIAIVYLNRGITRFEQGEVKGACRDWQKAFNLKANDAQDYLEKRCKQ